MNSYIKNRTSQIDFRKTKSLTPFDWPWTAASLLKGHKKLAQVKTTKKYVLIHFINPLFLFQNCNPLNDGSQNVHCQYHSIYTNQSDTEYQQRGAVMYDITAGQQINYFKIVNATVNLDEGRATLYGFNT